ncbi:MAG: hypothetical protein N2Z82_06915 [Thermomicrobium sp.]|nr:hypothetical protein [Thermomicrobium sp.]
MRPSGRRWLWIGIVLLAVWFACARFDVDSVYPDKGDSGVPPG